MFARKPIERILQEASSVPLKRTLGVSSLLLMGIGVTIGAGIFVLTGSAAAQAAGPAIALSFLLAAGGCALAGLCYAELAAMMPVAGSAYTYTYAALGEGIAWLVGWNLLLEYVFAASYVAVGWSDYAHALLGSSGLNLPLELTFAPFALSQDRLVSSGGWINLPAAIIVAAMTTVAVRGIGVSALLNAFIVALKLAVLLVFILVGALWVNSANWVPFIPANQGDFGQFGWSGVVRGAAIVFVAYLGFDAVATTAQETRRPQRDLPIAIMGTLAICALIFCSVALVLTGLVSYRSLNVGNPLSVALRNGAGSLEWLAKGVDGAAIVGLASVLLVILLAQPRIVLAMSRDGLLPSALGSIQPRLRTPMRATVLTGSVVCVLSSLFPIDLLSRLVSLGALCAFAAVCAGVLILRRVRPEVPRPFRVPLVGVIAPAGALLCTCLLVGLPRQSWQLYGGWMTLGVAVYSFYGRASARRMRFQDARALKSRGPCSILPGETGPSVD